MSQQNRRSRNPIGRGAVVVPPQIAPTPAHVPQPQQQHPQVQHVATNDNPELFVDLMMRAPLPIYVEKDVPGRDEIVRLIEKHGGAVATAYSTAPYILVDPTKESGQNLFRQYSAKRGKIVLSAQWVHACVTAGQLQAFKSNYAGYKVNGTERDQAPDHQPAPAQPRQPYYTGAPPPTQWATTNQQYSALTVPVIEGPAYPPYPSYPGDEQSWAAPGEDTEQYYDHVGFQQLPYDYIPAPAQTLAPTQPENPSQSPEPVEPEAEEEPQIDEDIYESLRSSLL